MKTLLGQSGMETNFKRLPSKPGNHILDLETCPKTYELRVKERYFKVILNEGILLQPVVTNTHTLLLKHKSTNSSVLH